MAKNVLLKIRSIMKKKKPTFKRQQWNQFPRIKNKKDIWRKPKGIQSKLRAKRKGHSKMPTVGYSSPKEVRGLNRDGFKEIVIYNVSDLSSINKENEIAVIGRTVGIRKKISILEEGKRLGLSFANVKNIDSKLSEFKLKRETAKKISAKKKALKKSSDKGRKSKGLSKKSKSKSEVSVEKDKGKEKDKENDQNLDKSQNLNKSITKDKNRSVNEKEIDKSVKKESKEDLSGGAKK